MVSIFFIRNQGVWTNAVSYLISNHIIFNIWREHVTKESIRELHHKTYNISGKSHQHNLSIKKNLVSKPHTEHYGNICIDQCDFNSFLHYYFKLKSAMIPLRTYPWHWIFVMYMYNQWKGNAALHSSAIFLFNFY